MKSLTPLQSGIWFKCRAIYKIKRFACIETLMKSLCWVSHNDCYEWNHQMRKTEKIKYDYSYRIQWLGDWHRWLTVALRLAYPYKSALCIYDGMAEDETKKKMADNENNELHSMFVRFTKKVMSN